ncbi:hypothetical protein F2Q68_00012438 [Brassica cretica]|uniref:TCP domain-containing protein n=1 Tax=Brassica cretica TaxID=69181 RepID=A0A8S9L0R7_BRACR|nr:hypothetical protein F2Q68_00012438 [Brassica cretica]
MRSRDCDEEEIQANQEGDHNHQLNLNSMFQPQNQPSSVPTSRQWTSAFRNPRIVRVSRTFGGKDRHSKVCTVRGLRDRRIRLSVPTAIQVYDLQDRLGLNQPSKVIDCNSTSSYYNLGHLQNSLDQSGNNVTVAIPNVPYNNNLNLPPPPTMSSLFPMYPSFHGASHHVVDGAGNLQLFSSNANRNNR